MKHTLLFLSLLLSFNSFASDMSRGESYNDAYKDVGNTTEYIGKCSLHQDYEDKKFTVGQTILDTVEPYDFSDEQYAEAIKNVDPALVAAFVELAGFETLKDTDDFTFEKVTSTVVSGLDLYRANVGVGGGNGIYIIINKITVNGKSSYELMSQIMDGDVEYCDSKVWGK
jgi:hypothetical protein